MPKMANTYNILVRRPDISSCSLMYEKRVLCITYAFTRSNSVLGWVQWRTQEFFFLGGVSTNSVEDRENGDLGA